MPRSYPPLSFEEVVQILEARGFYFVRKKSSHHIYFGYWNGKKRIVTVDKGIHMFNDPKLIRNMVVQSGMTREEYYGATPRTAKKISLQNKK